MESERGMREFDADPIRSTPLFRDVSDTSFAALTGAAFLQRFPANVQLIEEGEPADFLHVVVEGLVELFARHEGRESTLAFARPPATFILAAVVSDRVYLKSARTLAPSRILMIPAETVRTVFETDTGFARAVVRELALRYRDLVKELKTLKLRTGTERLANWLLAADLEAGGPGQIRLPCEKRTLASRLGMTPENLSRAFAALAGHGVSIKGRDVRLDRRVLEAFGKPSPLIDDFKI